MLTCDEDDDSDVLDGAVPSADGPLEVELGPAVTDELAEALLEGVVQTFVGGGKDSGGVALTDGGGVMVAMAA